MESVKMTKHIVLIVICLFISLLTLVIGTLNYSSGNDEKTQVNTESYNSGWELISEKGKIIDLPINLGDVNFGDIIKIKNKLPEDLLDNTYLLYRASHENVRFLIDNEEIYSFGFDDKRLFSKTPTCSWLFIPLSEEWAGKDIYIEIQGAYDNYKGYISELYMGDRASCIKEVVLPRLPGVIISSVIIVMGIIMVLVSIILRNGEITLSLFRLGVFSTVVGLWSILTANILQILFDKPFVLYNMEFFAYNLILPCLFWFLDSFEYYRNKKALKVFFVVSVVINILVNGLQLFNVMDYLETILCSHILWISTFLYLIISCVKELISRNITRELKILMISMGSAVIIASVDIIKFYLYIGRDDGFFVRIGILVFIIIWGTESIKKMSYIVVKMVETDMLKRLAFEDQVTKLKNRTAFETKTQELKKNKAENICIVEFDMNGLKKINDTFGHDAGDESLKNLGNVLEKWFDEIGNVYRTGGDEFCVLMEKCNKEKVEKINSIIKNVKKDFSENMLQEGYNASVASGLWVGNGEEDLDEIYKKADKKMYENKIEMKKEK